MCHKERALREAVTEINAIMPIRSLFWGQRALHYGIEGEKKMSFIMPPSHIDS